MKNLNEIDLGKIFKETLQKVGKKNMILVSANGFIVIALVVTGILINNKFQNDFSENESQRIKLEKEETFANVSKSEVEDLKIKIAEMKEEEYQRDLAVQTTETLKEIENLMVQYAFVNNVHKVEKPKSNKSLTEVPIEIEYIGSFEKSVQFIEELNTLKLPIALRDLKFYIPEEENEELTKAGNIKTSLSVIVTDDLMNVEKKGSKTEMEIVSNPFGFYVYEKKEETQQEETETIDAYQQYLQQFTKDKIKNELETEKENQTQTQTSNTSSAQTPSVTASPTTDGSISSATGGSENNNLNTSVSNNSSVSPLVNSSN